MTDRSFRAFTGAGTAITSAGALLLVLQGCAEGAGAPSAEVRDSAGVRIVTNPPAGGGVPVWRLSETPALEIGAVEGPEEAQLNRVAAVVGMPGGGVLVANAGVELRLFDAAGRHIRTVGGRGGGPGEFERISGVLLRGDTIYAYDGSQRRLTMFDTAGAVLGQETPLRDAAAGGMGAMRLAAITHRGEYVMLPEVFLPMLQPSPRLYRMERPNLIVGAARIDTVGASGVELYGGERGVMMPPFLRWSLAAADDSTVYVTHGERYEIEVWRTDGGIRSLVRISQPPPELSGASWDSAIEASVQTMPQDRRADALAFRRTMPPYRTAPAYGGGLVVRPGGGFAAQEWADFSNRGPRRWHLFDADGQLEAVLETPGGFTMLAIHGGRALGVWRDELDVEYVRAYDIVGPGGAHRDTR